MKTRRILAASTAALLAFGTTAAYVASAEVTVGVKKGYGKNGVANTTDAAKINAAMEKYTVAISGKTITVTFTETEAEVLDWDKTASDAGLDNELALVCFQITDAPAGELTVNGSPSPSFTRPLEAGETGNIQVWLNSANPDNVKFKVGTTEYTIVKKYAPDYEDEVKLTYNKDGINVAPGVTVSYAKDDSKEMGKIYMTVSEPVKPLGVQDGDDVVVNTEDDALFKKLPADIKEQFESVKTDNVRVCNIDLNDGTYHVYNAPTSVTVKLTVNLKDAYVYHVDPDDGYKVEKVSASQKTLAEAGKYELTFKTKRFSPFIITTADLKGVSKITEPAGTTEPGTQSAAATSSAATSDGASTTNPETGIALAIAPVVLAAGAVAVVALKKKH